MTYPQQPGYPAQPGYGAAPGATAFVEVEAKVFPLAFLFYLFKPKAAIDGYEVPISWGVNRIPVSPGQHLVEAWLPYIFYRNMGRNGAVLEARPDAVPRLWWRTPWIAFIKGPIRVSVSGPAAGAPGAPGGPAVAAPAAAPFAAAPPAGAWHPDPSGRNEQRYYDGTQWTEHVSNGGVTSTDPVV